MRYCEEGWEYKQGDITFVIGGMDYDIPSHHWNGRAKPEFETFLGHDGVCSSTIEPLDIHIDGLEDLFIAGDTFM